MDMKYMEYELLKGVNGSDFNQIQGIGWNF